MQDPIETFTACPCRENTHENELLCICLPGAVGLQPRGLGGSSQSGAWRRRDTCRVAQDMVESALRPTVRVRWFTVHAPHVRRVPEGVSPGHQREMARMPDGWPVVALQGARSGWSGLQRWPTAIIWARRELEESGKRRRCVCEAGNGRLDLRRGRLSERRGRGPGGQGEPAI